METAPNATGESRLEAIAGKITAGIYAAPLAQATARQRELALSIAGNIVAMLDAERPKIWAGFDMSADDLAKLRADMGPREWNNLYLCQHEPAEGAYCAHCESDHR